MDVMFQQYGMLAIRVVVFAVLGFFILGGKLPNFGAITANIGSRFKRSATTNTVSVDIDQDTLEHQATMLLAARATRRKCPECLEAIKKYQTHWLDDNSQIEG